MQSFFEDGQGPESDARSKPNAARRPMVGAKKAFKKFGDLVLSPPRAHTTIAPPLL